jgi:penicillin-binding protein 2
VFRRRKTLQLPPEPGKNGDDAPSKEDERLISRRLLLMRGGVGLGFAALAGKLWQMQVARSTEFEDVVSGNILRFERLKPARGRILDRVGAPLAENRRIWTVRIVPDRLPDDEEERANVLKTVEESLQLGYGIILDRRQMPLGTEAAIVDTVERRIDGVEKDAIMARLSIPGTTMVMLKDGLSAEEADAYIADRSDIPGLRALTVLEYQLETHASDDIPMVVKRDVDREIALILGSNSVHIPGVEVDDYDLVREYSGGTSFSHLLGYVGPITEEEYQAATTVTGTAVYERNDVVGRGGVEEALEQELRGTKGGRWIQIDSAGVERFELLERRREAIAGLSVQMTVDREFQARMTEALQDGIDFANRAAFEEDREPVKAGVAIAMNPQDGEILGMVSLPTFDNQRFIDGMTDAEFSNLINDPDDPLLNRAISGTYAPGSVFKPLLAGIGLQEGVIDTEMEFECKGRLRVPWSWDESQGNDYVCWVGEPGHGAVNVYSAIADSCDIYFYNVGAPYDKPDEEDFPNADFLHYYNPGDTERHYFRGLGIDRIASGLKDEFMLGRPSGIELAGEAEGLVPTPEWFRKTFEGGFWSVGDTINVSIGQGHLLMTPLQMLNSTAAIANGGTLWRPRLVKALVREDGRIIREFGPQVLRELEMAPEHIETVRLGMRRTITSGTGEKPITFSEPPIGGKSGTAEYGIAVDGSYELSHAWFTAFGPYENPEIAVAVLIVSGDAGSIYAGPVANNILKAYFEID